MDNIKKHTNVHIKYCCITDSLQCSVLNKQTKNYLSMSIGGGYLDSALWIRRGGSAPQGPHAPPLSHTILLPLVHAEDSTFNHGSTCQASTASHLLILHWSKPITQLSPMSNQSVHDEAKASHITKPISHGTQGFCLPKSMKQNE